MSLGLPDLFDKRRDEKAITQRMAQIRQEVADLLASGWEVYTIDEVWSAGCFSDCVCFVCHAAISQFSSSRSYFVRGAIAEP